MAYLRVVETTQQIRVNIEQADVRVSPQVVGLQGPSGPQGPIGPEGPPFMPEEWESPPDLVILFDNALL